MITVSNSEPAPNAQSKRALLAERLRMAAEKQPALPLSFAQQRLWFLDQLEPNSALYNVPTLVKMTGTLNLDAFQKSIDALVERHEILRTRFECTNGQPVQIVESHVDTKVHLQDLTALPLTEREKEAQKRLRAEINRPFDLASGPLIRATLLRLAEDRHWFILNFHHIVSDEWSLKVCFRELTSFYKAHVRGETPRLPELSIQYSDYALWQRDWLNGEILQKQLGYWRQQLEGNPPVLELPSDRPRPAIPSFRGATKSRTLPPELCAPLKDIGARHGASLFMVLLAAFKALLHRYTQQEDILIGSPIAGRNRVETEELIGFFVNTLMLRTRVSANLSFEELLQRVRETTLGAYAHPDLPFEKLVEELRPERTLSHMPFTRLMFALQKNGFEELQWPGVVLRFQQADGDTAKFDLTFVVQELESGLTAHVEYNRDLFDGGTVERLLAHFEILLTGIAENPRRRICELSLLDEGERRQILMDWNATSTEYPRDKSICDLFEEQAQRTPDAVAVAYGSESLTYAELNSRANQVARHLAKFSVGPDIPVGLCAARSVEMIVGMLGILKAGGAYVPLDPSYPKARLEFMLEDTRAPVVLTQEKLLDRLPRNAARVVCLDSDWDLIARESRTNLSVRLQPDHLAYVIYTSGSTGQPKGVAVPHQAVVRLVRNTNYIQITASDRVAQASNASFDAATFEVWGALLNGAELRGVSKEIALSARDFAQELREQKMSVLFLTTALFNQLAAEQPDTFATLRVVLFGGETVDPKWVRVVLEHRPEHLLHVYGPTENTTFSTYHPVREVREDAHTIPIGRPISNTECYILDSHLNPVPVGVPGELHLSGDGIARGYWNRPDRSAQKFIPNPFRSERGSSLLYKTGDLVRWLPDGSIEFIGRADQQVKVRGFRVELGEIETVLARHPGVRECAVIVYQSGAGDKKLAAYFAPAGSRSPGAPELREFLRDKLPDYMLPSAFVRVDALPLTPNGKVDRKALPQPDKARPELEKRYATPRDAVEVELTRIWENVLGVHPIGIEDKFFELGGHSLLAVRLIAQIEKAFGRKLRLATIFQAQTIEQLAAILRKEIQEESALSGTSIVEIQPKGTRAPLFFVHGAGGGMFWGYVNLSRHLGTDQPVYGIRSRGLDGGEEFTTLEKMAEQYIADIRAIQPHGPYHLGGYCFGGNVAYEMARMLTEQGETVETLALFNCAPPNSRYDRLSWSPRWTCRFIWNLGYWFKYFLSWTPSQRREFFRWKKEMLKRRTDRFLRHKAQVAVDPGELVDLSSYSPDQRKLWENHIRALVTHRPKPFPGRVHLFRSPGHPLLCSFDADYGWGDFARGGVQITIVPGVHEKILEEPCVEHLAQELNAVLNSQKAQTNGKVSGDHAHAQPAGRNGSNGSTTAVRPAARRPSENAAYPLDKTYVQLFEAQAARTPDRVALRFEGAELTYRQLSERADQLAHHLQSTGVGPETLVAICLERSVELPLAILAVLKAGGAYLPLDSEYPPERLSYMLEDSQARVLITSTRFLDRFDTTRRTVLCLDDEQKRREIESCPASAPACRARAENLAYVIYTSGSTGKPKGVQITHRNLVNHNYAMAHLFKLSPEDRALQFSPYSFDISIEEIFPSWLFGCTVVFRPKEMFLSMRHFLDFVRAEQLTILNLPTAYWNELTEALSRETLPPSVRLVVIGGEKASDETWRRWKTRVNPRVMLLNSYGPTETTVTATVHVAQPGEDSLPIGRPIGNVYAVILDNELRKVPLGEAGELHIGGAGVARGYLNRPDLTAQKFIPNPFPEIPSDRLYKTGDVARLRADGEIEFVGRVDEQVKIRGYRIELGEIEETLRTHPDLKEAVVVAREDVPGKKRLVGYVVARSAPAPNVGSLQHFLRDRLPPYMIPTAFVVLDALPLTPAGKVDRRSLPVPADTRPELDQQFVAPRTPMEEVLARIWEEVLGIDRVGVHDNFFDLGGHSLLAMQVISRIRDTLKVEVALTSIFDFPTVAVLAERFSDASSQAQPVVPLSAVSADKELPLTPAQQRIWFLDHFDPQQSAYNIPTALRLTGPLNLPALEDSLTELSRRHEALRAFFPAKNGQPTQVICETKPIHLQVIDLNDVPESEREKRAWEIAGQEAKKSHFISRPILRPVLIRLGASEHLLLLITHEIACDAHSVKVLIDELAALYEAYSANRTPELAPLPLSYADAIAREPLAPDTRNAHLDFWKRALEGAPPLLNLPADRPRPAHSRDAGARESLVLSKELSAAVEQFAEREKCSPFVALVAAFKAVLFRYTGVSDLVIGSTVSTRNRPELANIVGRFNNTVVLRSDFSGNPTFRECLDRARRTVEDALKHSALPFETLVNELKPARNASYTPVYQVMFDYDEETLPAREAGGMRFQPVRLDNDTSKLDLKFYLGRTPDGFVGWAEYSTLLFDADRITRAIHHFKTLLESAVQNPDQRLSELPLLDYVEAHRVLIEWNSTAKPYARNSTLHQLFEEQAQRSPDAVALVDGAERITYSELNARANQIAHYLRSRGAGPGSLVGICHQHSWQLIAAMLGVLKSGAAYVPIDPAHPKDRICFILEDTQVAFLLTEQSLRASGSPGPEAICLEALLPQLAGESRENVFSGAESSDLACIIHTSGSTGRPKGVAVEHRNVVALIAWARDTFSSEELAGVLASTPVCFDLSVFEIFVPLSLGGAVILAENALALPSLPAAAEVTLINTVPSAIRELLRAKGVPPNVRVINLAGEPLPTALVDRIYSETSVQKVWDLYGPTETTTYSTCGLRLPGEPAHIGRPIANEQIYILDQHMEPVPIGIPGEIYIGGDGVARGYLNRPDATAERFVPNPFHQGTRLYRSGDLGRWRRDGTIEFLGRIDHQVKIRGCRVELGEVESVLRRHPDVRDVAVMAHEDRSGNQQLVAYIVLRIHIETAADALRGFARQLLPEYMVPGSFILLDKLPLTPNGKLDRKALPQPEQDRQQSHQGFVAPRNPIEEQLAMIWRELLNVSQVSIHDNFFDLDGHSLMAIQVVLRIREIFAVELPLFSVFETPTIAGLAEGLVSGRWTSAKAMLPLQRAPRDGELPASMMQAGIWFVDQLNPGNCAYNVPSLIRLKGELNVEHLQRALDEVIARHEALRTTIVYRGNDLKQVIAPPAPVHLRMTDLRDYQPEAAEKEALRIAKEETHQPFDFSRGPLARFHLIRVADREHFFSVVIHHAVCDGCSISVFFSELEHLYNSLNSRTRANLPELPVQFADFAHWQREWMRGAVLQQELAFWREKLRGAPSTIALPADCPEPEKPTRACNSARIDIPKEIAGSLAMLAQREGKTPFMILMSALALVLHKWTEQRDLVIGTVVAGRNRREIENVIGCFINFLPIRIQFDGLETVKDLLDHVKLTVLDAQAHQDCPFEKLVEALRPERRAVNNPIYNVTFLLQNFDRIRFEPAGLASEFIPLKPEASPVDLEFETEETLDGLEVRCDYRTDLFEQKTIEQLLQAYRQVLQELIGRPEAPLKQIDGTRALPLKERTQTDSADKQTLAIAATFTAEPVEDSLQYWMKELDIPCDVQFAAYNQVFQQLLDPAGLFAQNTRGVNIVLVRLEDWERDEKQSGGSHAKIERTVHELIAALKTAAHKHNVPHLVCICPSAKALAANRARAPFFHRMESLLAEALADTSGVFVVTGAELSSLYPVGDVYDARGDELGHVPYTPVFFTALGTMIARKFHALRRPAHKVIVLDCDQTLWAGVCGEDGVKGICLDAPRRALQEFMRAQLDCGRLLAVSSKNNPEDVEAVFSQRKDFPLRREHFAAWRLNWRPKSENLRSLAKELNLGLDSFIFVDDNPVECAEVEANCPEVMTLQLPEQPEQIPQFLRHCWVFDYLKVTAEDRKRSEMYLQNRQREQLRARSMSLANFLASLELKIQFGPMTPDQLARVAQLTQRTNQFNCTTIRRSETEVQTLLAQENHQIFAASVSDRFGDYGLVGVVICEWRPDALDVETFLLSCRVLGRGVEHELLARLGRWALEKGRPLVDVHFHPSPKNKPAFDFLQNVAGAYRQALNGGYVYRIPADFAAGIAFVPQEEDATSVPAKETREINVAATSDSRRQKFIRCRQIAIEANDAIQIHETIQSKAKWRSTKQKGYTAPTTSLERQLCEIWQRLLRVERIGTKDNFFELGGHSLLAVRLFAELEELLGRKFPLVTIFQAPTVEELARALDESNATRARSPIFPIQPNGSKPPLFLVHGAGGDVLWGYANLARCMNPDQPIYGIKSRGQIGLEEYTRIEDMARYYLEEIRAVQPAGPYYLGGYCLGGNIAYEMARQLHEQGEHAALVALIDSSPANVGYERVQWWKPEFMFQFGRNLGYWLDDFGDLPVSDRLRFVARKSRTLWRKLLRKASRQRTAEVDLEEVIDPSHFPEHELNYWRIHLQALDAHIQQPYAGDVTLIRTLGQPLLCSFAKDFCWSKVVRGQVAVKVIPGSHENIFMEPHVQHLAKELEACLSRSRAASTCQLTEMQTA